MRQTSPFGPRGRRTVKEPPVATERDTSIRRGLNVLLALGGEEAVGRRGLGVTRIAELIGKEKSQVSRSLALLAEYGFVERDSKTLAYRLGWRVTALAQRVGNHQLVDKSQEVLAGLLAQVDESVCVSVPAGETALTVAERFPGKALQASSGTSFPVFATSVGRALLSGLSDDAIRARYSGVAVATRGPYAVGTVDQLLERVRKVRDDGYCVVVDEFEDGITSVGVPVRDRVGAVIAAIGISGPTFRFACKATESAENAVKAATALEASLANGNR
jgi:DNA-binding IclR family transcriptional regulator